MYVSHFLLSILAACCFILGLPPISLFPLSWAGWIPLFFILFSPKCRAGSLIFNTYICGLIYYAAALKWLIPAGLELYAAAAAAYALLFPLFFGFLHAFAVLTRTARPLCFAAPLLWIAYMSLLEFSPLSYIPAEALFYGAVPFHQASAFGAFWLLPGLIIALGASLAYYLHERNFARFLLVLLFASGLGALGWWGQKRIVETDDRPPLKLALIQHNLSPVQAWNDSTTLEIRSAYREFALMASRLKPDMIVFPFYAWPEAPFEDANIFGAIASTARLSLLAALSVDKERSSGGTPLNMAFFYSREGKLIDSYREEPKPAGNYLAYLQVQKGRPRVVESAGTKIGILLNFEDLRGRPAEEARAQGAKVLIALPDPALLKSDNLSALMLVQDQLRAIETGLPVARLSARGYSAFISPSGKILKKTGLNEEAILITEIPENNTVPQTAL